MPIALRPRDSASTMTPSNATHALERPGAAHAVTSTRCGPDTASPVAPTQTRPQVSPSGPVSSEHIGRTTVSAITVSAERAKRFNGDRGRGAEELTGREVFTDGRGGEAGRRDDVLHRDQALRALTTNASEQGV